MLGPVIVISTQHLYVLLYPCTYPGTVPTGTFAPPPFPPFPPIPLNTQSQPVLKLKPSKTLLIRLVCVLRFRRHTVQQGLKRMLARWCNAPIFLHPFRFLFRTTCTAGSSFDGVQLLNIQVQNKVRTATQTTPPHPPHKNPPPQHTYGILVPDNGQTQTFMVFAFTFLTNAPHRTKRNL